MGALSKMSLKKSFMLIIVISLLLALISSLLFMVICDAVIDICNFTGTIPAADIDTDLLNSAGQGVVIQNENGNLDISTSYYSYHIEPYYTIIYVIKIVVPVIIFIVSLICADIIFFKVKLKINFMFSSILPILFIYSHFVAFAFFPRHTIIAPVLKPVVLNSDDFILILLIFTKFLCLYHLFVSSNIKKSVKINT